MAYTKADLNKVREDDNSAYDDEEDWFVLNTEKESKWVREDLAGAQNPNTHVLDVDIVV